MDSASLRQAKIEIYKLKDRETNYGVYADDLTLVYTTRASTRFDTMSKSEANGEVSFPINRTFYVRSYVPVDYNCYIKYEDRFWEVVSVNKDVYYNNIVINTVLLNE